MSHTPGPWSIEPCVAKGAWIAGPTKEWAALACGNTDETARANAKLIAAAPDMLDALKRAKQSFDNSIMFPENDFDRETERMVNEAITNAEGST
jgi:hypothetical protein